MRFKVSTFSLEASYKRDQSDCDKDSGQNFSASREELANRCVQVTTWDTDSETQSCSDLAVFQTPVSSTDDAPEPPADSSSV